MHIDQQIEQLEAVVEKRLDLCQETWQGFRCTLPANHGPAEEHRFAAGERVELQKIITSAFGLSRAHREIFLLCDIQGFKVAKAAAMLDISLADARMRLAQARREMHARLRADL